MQRLPADLLDEELQAPPAPAEWRNPVPSGRYNLVIIGAGTAGLAAASDAAAWGAKVAVVERHRLGGGRLSFGGLLSSAFFRSARAAHEITTAHRLGIATNGACDFAAIMSRMHALRAQWAQEISAAQLAALGIDVYFGEGRFSGPQSIVVDGQSLAFSRALVATGAQPVEPLVEGLAELEALTSETVETLEQLPQTLVILGAGRAGCQWAQAFRRLGSNVHLVTRDVRILMREDAEVSELLAARLKDEGVHLHLGYQAVQAARMGTAKSLVVERNGQKQLLIGDALLLAAGRQAAVSGLDLPAAGIAASEQGIVVNDYLQTTNRRVYAAGGACVTGRATSAAEAMAHVAVRNALFLRRGKLSRWNIPRCVFTDPEIAHVGLTASEARNRNVAIDSYRVVLPQVDRALLDNQSDGFAVVHTRAGSGKVMGGTIVAAHAGEMIGELALLMNENRSIASLARSVHAHPTQAEVLSRIAEAYRRGRVTPRREKLLRRWLAWRR